jgi:hypothetical protein
MNAAYPATPPLSAPGFGGQDSTAQFLTQPGSDADMPF